VIRSGDRFRITRSIENKHVLLVRRAPAHTAGCEGSLPKGTVIVAMDQAAGATGFSAYPENYDEVERQLVPAEVRTAPEYRAYYLSFHLNDVGDLLEPIRALSPRPGNRLPRPV
jgi:hypothetical protein